MEDYESLPHGLPVSCLEIQQQSLHFFQHIYIHFLFYDHACGHAYAQALYPLLLVSLALVLHELTLTNTELALTDPLAAPLTAPLTCHAYFQPSTPSSSPLPPTKSINPQPGVPYLTPHIHQTGSLTVYVNAHLPSIAPSRKRIRKRSPPQSHLSRSRSRSRSRIRFSPPFTLSYTPTFALPCMYTLTAPPSLSIGHLREYNNIYLTYI